MCCLLPSAHAQNGRWSDQVGLLMEPFLLVEHGFNKSSSELPLNPCYLSYFCYS